jgi:hypothetical protein
MSFQTVEDFSIVNESPLHVFKTHVGCVIFGECEQAIVTCRSCVFVNPKDFTAAAQFGIASEVRDLNAYPGKGETCFGGVHVSRDVVAPLTFRRTIGCSHVILNGQRLDGFYMADIDTRHAEFEYTHLPVFSPAPVLPLWNPADVNRRTFELAAVMLVFPKYLNWLMALPLALTSGRLRERLQHLVVFRSLCCDTWYNQALLWHQERLMRMLRPPMVNWAPMQPSGHNVRVVMIHGSARQRAVQCNGHDYLLPSNVADWAHTLYQKIRHDQARVMQGVVMEARPFSVFAGQLVGDATFTPNNKDFIIRKLFTYIRTIVRMWEHAGYGYDGQRFVLGELVDNAFNLTDAERRLYKGRDRVVYRVRRLAQALSTLGKRWPTFTASFLIGPQD